VCSKTFNLPFYILLSFILFPLSEVNAAEKHTFSFSLGGSWNDFGAIKSDDYSDLLKEHNFKSGIGPFFEIVYFVSPRFSCSGGMEFQYGKKHKVYYYPNSSDPQSIQYNSSTFKAFIPRFEIRYYIPTTRFDYYISIGQMLCFGTFKSKYTFDPPRPLPEKYNNKYTGNGYGVSCSGGLKKELNDRFGLSIQAGYRYLQTGKMFNVESNHPLRDGLHYANLNFSGPFAGVNLSFQL
jgi:hypothetical protein